LFASNQITIICSLGKKLEKNMAIIDALPFEVARPAGRSFSLFITRSSIRYHLPNFNQIGQSMVELLIKQFFSQFYQGPQ